MAVPDVVQPLTAHVNAKTTLGETAPPRSSWQGERSERQPRRRGSAHGGLYMMCSRLMERTSAYGCIKYTLARSEGETQSRESAIDTNRSDENEGVLCVCERGEGGCLSAPPSLPSTLLRLLLSSPPPVPSRPRRARSRGGRCAPFSGPSLLITPFVTSAVNLLHRKRASSSRKRNSRRLSQTITDVQMCPSGFLYRRRSCVPSQQLR